MAATVTIRQPHRTDTRRHRSPPKPGHRPIGNPPGRSRQVLAKAKSIVVGLGRPAECAQPGEQGGGGHNLTSSAPPSTTCWALAMTALSHGAGMSAATPPQVTGRLVFGDLVPPHGMLLWRAYTGQKSRLSAGCGGVAAQLPFSGRGASLGAARLVGQSFLELSLPRPIRTGDRAGRMAPCIPHAVIRSRSGERPKSILLGRSTLNGKHGGRVVQTGDEGTCSACRSGTRSSSSSTAGD